MDMPQDSMSSDDVRNQLLMELIEQMHGRMADKMYPPEMAKPEDMPMDPAMADDKSAMPSDPSADMPKDMSKDMPQDSDGDSAEDAALLEELMKTHGV